MVRRQNISYAPHPRFEELAAFARRHPDRYIERFYQIPEEDTAIPIDLKLRYGQRVAYDAFKEDWDSGDPVREFWLKSRRVGLTVLFASLGLTYATVTPNCRVGIIAHNEFRSRGILKTFKFIRKRLPERGINLRLSVDSNEGLRMSHNDAEVMVGTCNEPAKVRGDGLQWAHLSEPAHYGRQFWLTMLETATTIAPRAHTVSILETTGKGRGSRCHKFWEAAKAKEVIYKARFLRWMDDPTYQLPFDSDLQKRIVLEEIQSIEPRLMEKFRFYKLTPEQMHWAYLKDYIYRCNQDYEYYCREFPYDDEEAWDSKGLSFFGDNEIAEMAKRCYKPLYFTFENRFINQLFRSFNELQLCTREPDLDSGTLVVKLWKMPEPGHTYVLGADSSLGERGGTYSAGYVIDLESREMMCAYRGRIRPDEHAYLMGSIGWIFNEAILAPEVNAGGGGLEAMNNLQRIGYTRLYIWRLRDDKRGIILSQKLGWVTNTLTRPIMLNELRKMFIDAAHNRFHDPGMFKDKRFISEARTFQKDSDTGRIEASDESYDDTIFALGIAHRVAADEVFGGSLDLYASYANEKKQKGPFAELLDHYDSIANGQDPCNVIDFLTDGDFELDGQGHIQWIDQ